MDENIINGVEEYGTGASNEGSATTVENVGENSSKNVNENTSENTISTVENSTTETENNDPQITKLHEEIAKLREELSKVFANEHNTTERRNEVESYIYSEDSLTSRIMKSYGIKEDK